MNWNIMKRTAEIIAVQQQKSVLYTNGLIKSNTIESIFRTVHEKDGYYECTVYSKGKNGIADPLNLVMYPDGGTLRGFGVNYVISFSSDGRKTPKVLRDGDVVSTLPDYIKSAGMPGPVANNILGAIQTAREYCIAVKNVVTNDYEIKMWLDS